ncbi:hypothetical protein ABZX56_11105 [Streptomyces parvulus]|uniref:hypothetical protein n=1 Tax=Streptomyces parvulus TaxID=146923 RepID=UPI0033AAE4D8
MTTTPPITVFWDHSIVSPAAGTDETTLVLCKGEAGEAVALSLPGGQRRALALKLIDPTDASAHIARLAFLREHLRRMQPGERLTSKQAARHLTKRGYPAINQEGAARRDLATLHREGLLVQHEESGSRWYTLPSEQDEALTLECSTASCRSRAPLCEARESWSRPAGERGWLCPDCVAGRTYREVWEPALPPGGYVCSTCGEPVESEPCPDHAPDFFQAGHTYRHTRWTFRVDVITTHPQSGERAALGWWWFGQGSWLKPFTADDDHWQSGWRDISHPARAIEKPEHATPDAPKEGA